MFMTSGGYKHVFGEQHQSNAYMVRLKNHETSNVESRSAKLMKLDGVKGIVQNTTSKKQQGYRPKCVSVLACVPLWQWAFLLFELYGRGTRGRPVFVFN